MGTPRDAVDGKTLRGARQPQGRPAHLLAAMDHATGAVLAQRQVDGAPEEVTGFQPLLADLDLAGSGWRGRGVVQPSVCLANRTVCSRSKRRT